MSAPRAIDRPFAIACAAAVGLFFAAYANSLHNGFHFDDDHVIERNLYLRDLSNIPRFFADARTFSSFTQNATYRPLVSTSLAVDYALGGGLNPVPFHLSQLLMFLAVAALLGLVTWDVLRRTGESPWHRWAALFAAALFAVHTANSQPGNYLSARSELLCALGVLGSFVLYLRAPGLRRFGVYLVPMALGALAKPPAVVFAPLLFLFHLLFEGEGQPLLRRLRGALVASLPAFVAGAALFVFVERMNPPGQTYGGGDRLQYLWTQAFVWLRYARLFFWPTGLSADTDLSLLPTWRDARVFGGVAFFAATAAGALFAATRPKLRPVALGLGWYWIGILPTSVVPLAEVTNDHRMFLGYLGASLALAAGAFHGASLLRGRSWRVPAVAAVATGVLIAHSAATHVRNRVWLNEETLWADVVEKSPNNGRAWMNYGLTQMRKGELRKAKALFDRAYTLTPNYPVLEVNLGIVNAALGDPAAAEPHFQRALALAPTYAGAHTYYARFLIEQGKGPRAEAHLRRSIALEAADPHPRQLLLELLAAKGDQPGLTALARETLALGPDPHAQARLSGRPSLRPATDDAQGWFELGFSLTQANRHAAAAEAYRVALRLAPDHADAWNNLGWSLLSLGFYPEAEAALSRATSIDPAHPRAKNNLAELRARITNP